MSEVVKWAAWVPAQFEWLKQRTILMDNSNGFHVRFLPRTITLESSDSK